ncbi:protein singed-like [Pecten maximus]|uniref:protein singed-like n=1 Tax=Pecten maximus TaxID=6579 RepID=UPI001458699B|nr:protein singed-like [Pecten maximus]
MSQTNGINGHSKGTVSEMSWKVGLLNCHTKYLTAESFGKLNITGSNLKKKQIWTIEHDTVNEGVIYLKSPQTTDDTYIFKDRHGNVTLKEKEDECKFVVEYGDGEYSGLWAFRNVKSNGLLGTDPEKKDEVKCFNEGKPTNLEYWTVQLSIHPQVNIQHDSRYVQLCNDELQFSETIPWGAPSLIVLEFHEGKYALKTSDDRYLTNDGTLSEECTDESKFTLEIHSGKERVRLAFKDCQQRYLKTAGHSRTMKARNTAVTKDELFVIEDCHPQVVFISDAGKMISVKQGTH